MSQITDKDQLGRVEKYAQAHLDRVHTISSGATKTALAWLVALAIIWWQLLEPKLVQIQAAQMSGRAVVSSSTLGPQLVGVREKFQKDEDVAKQEQLELPFSIKFKLPPTWVATLWLILAFGLCWYLLDTRRRVLRIAARGLRLLTTEVDAEPAYVRSIVGEAVWWLAPLPTRKGQVIGSDQLRLALGWHGRNFGVGLVALMLCVVFLVAATRVLYIGFCVTSYLTGLNHSPSFWLSITAVNCLLFFGSMLLVWRWFATMSVPDFMNDEQRPGIGRRQMVVLLRQGGVIMIAAFAWIATSTYFFARITQRRKPRLVSQTKVRTRRKKKRHLPTPILAKGLYLNPKTGTIHAASPDCKTCLIRTNASRLTMVTADTVQWNGLPKSLRAARSFNAMPVLRPSRDNRLREYQSVSSSMTGAAVESHPHLVHRTFMVEQRALELLREGKGAEACRFLLATVQSTPVFGLKTGMRLFDLLAGLTVRFNRADERNVLVKVLRDEKARVQSLERKIEQSHTSRVLNFLYRLSNNVSYDDTQRQRHHEHHKKARSAGSKRAATDRYRTHNEFLMVVIDDRIKKWQSVDGRWYRTWANRGKAIKWAGETVA